MSKAQHKHKKALTEHAQDILTNEIKMEVSNAHTPGPRQLWPSIPGTAIITLPDRTVYQFGSPTDAASAARAIRCHADLLAACEAAQGFIAGSYRIPHKAVCKCHQCRTGAILRAAIAKAKGTP